MVTNHVGSSKQVLVCGVKKHASGSYHRFDPRLTISNEALQYLDDGDFRYLGRPTNVQRSESRCRAEVEAQLSQWLDTINDLDLPATSKLWLYQHFVVSKTGLGRLPPWTFR